MVVVLACIARTARACEVLPAAVPAACDWDDVIGLAASRPAIRAWITCHDFRVLTAWVRIHTSADGLPPPSSRLGAAVVDLFVVELSCSQPPLDSPASEAVAISRNVVLYEWVPVLARRLTTSFIDATSASTCRFREPLPFVRAMSTRARRSAAETVGRIVQVVEALTAQLHVALTIVLRSLV